MIKPIAQPASIPSADVSLRRYLDDIRKAEPLAPGEEAALFGLYRGKGSREARARIIAANMRFVVKVALRFRACPMPLCDLISEGALGLIHAVETFDAGRGVKFISYAVWWIRSHITKALNEKGFLIRLPANQYFRLRKAASDRREGPEDEGLRVLRRISQGCVSLDGSPPGGRPWSDTLTDPTAPDPALQAELASGSGLTERMLEAMPDRERSILRRTFGIGTGHPSTLKEVGRDLSLSAERVRQLRSLALLRLRADPALHPLRERYASLAETRPG